MNLTPMRFKNYTWPHNPRVYSIDFQRAVAAYKMPFGRYQLQDLGMGCRVMEGSGEFVGPESYREFQRLACVFYEDGPGLLLHPLWQATNAYFVSLRVDQVPQPDYVRYSFTFWEDCDLYKGLDVQTEKSMSDGRDSLLRKGSQAVFHRVVKGDTLWALARRYGISTKELAALNPQIKNPNLIRVGEEVRVR